MAGKRFIFIVAICLALTLFWDSGLVRPVKLLVVLVHEIWHGLLSLVAGVRLDGIEVHWNESGKTLVTGNFSPVGFIAAVSAGYIGCAVTGAFLLRQSLVGRGERVTLLLFSVLLLYFSWLFTSPLQTAFYTGMGYGLALLVFAALGRKASAGALTALGVFFMFYSLFDLFDFTRDVDSTDAAILAGYLGSDALESGSVGLTAVTISLIWTLAILLLSYWILAPAIRESIRFEAPAIYPEGETAAISEAASVAPLDESGTPLAPQEASASMAAMSSPLSTLEPPAALSLGPSPRKEVRRSTAQRLWHFLTDSPQWPESTHSNSEASQDKSIQNRSGHASAHNSQRKGAASNGGSPLEVLNLDLNPPVPDREGILQRQRYGSDYRSLNRAYETRTGAPLPRKPTTRT